MIYSFRRQRLVDLSGKEEQCEAKQLETILNGSVSLFQAMLKPWLKKMSGKDWLE